MKQKKNLTTKTIDSIMIGGKKIKIGKGSIQSSKGGSFDELVKGLKNLSKKNIFESTL